MLVSCWNRHWSGYFRCKKFTKPQGTTLTRQTQKYRGHCRRVYQHSQLFWPKLFSIVFNIFLPINAADSIRISDDSPTSGDQWPSSKALGHDGAPSHSHCDTLELLEPRPRQNRNLRGWGCSAQHRKLFSGVFWRPSKLGEHVLKQHGIFIHLKNLNKWCVGVGEAILCTPNCELWSLKSWD